MTLRLNPMDSLNMGCLKHLLGIVANTFDAYSAVLFLPDEEGVLRMAAHFSLGDDLAEGAEVVPGKGLVGWILRNDQPLLVNNFELQTESLGYYSGRSESAVKSFMGCPLRDGQGIVCVDSKKSYSFSTKDQKILHQFAEFISKLQLDSCRQETNRQDFVYYQALRELQELRQRYPLWSAYLHQFLHILARTTQIKHVALAARDEYGQNFFIEGWTDDFPIAQRSKSEKYPFGSGLVGWVFKNEKPVFSADAESGHTGATLFAKDVIGGLALHTVICLPLSVHKRTRAVLILADEAPRDIADEMRFFLRLVTEYLEFFLENLYLKNQVSKLQSQLSPKTSPIFRNIDGQDLPPS
ncbi:GAF domain-containing protein [Desulfonatronum thiodismutans]|uniref:GAF domain-containing protein n=1 Tax=Desulfonatronum thiodismutans TaxID=159290 RepID=UPI00068B1628|nr:GAF domain-containing protein [Desulfonatronum thiodismutans]